jgi:cytochrome P450
VVAGLPIIGNALGMAKDPARFFVRCYREHGPVFRVRLMGRTCTVIAGADAANFLNTREGRECLRSKEFWQGLVDEYGATRVISGEDGGSHKELREIMRRGYSREAVKGRFDELVAITDRSIERDWRPGERVPVVRAMQYMVTDQLGSILTGGNLVRDSLVRDIMHAHVTNPRAMPAEDLVLSLTGPYVAGLDTVANTVGAFVYAVLKHPEVLARVQAEADALFAGGGSLDDESLRKIPAIRGALMETMRMYPIAVAQMRTVTRDFTFAGHPIKAGERSTSARACRTSWPSTFPTRTASTSTGTRSRAPSTCGRGRTRRTGAGSTPAWARASPTCR